MAATRISDLPAAALAVGTHQLPVADGTAVSKKITVQQIVDLAAIGGAPLLLTGGTLTGPLLFSGATNPGFAPNNLTTTQRDALGVVANGTTIFNTTTSRTEYYLVGTGWVQHVRLSGDTMTGALVLAAGGLVFNGSVLNAGGANIVSLSNLANAQSLRVYNTTDGTNAEWLSIDWTTLANFATLNVTKSGTGAQRSLLFAIGGAFKWIIDSGLNGALRPGVDNGIDFGTGVQRIRDAYFGRNIVQSVGTQITAAATITPTSPIVHVTGATPIATITVPAGMATAGNGGSITLIPDSAFTTTSVGGNIALASTAVINRALVMTWDNTAAKWFPGY